MPPWHNGCQFHTLQGRVSCVRDLSHARCTYVLASSQIRYQHKDNSKNLQDDGTMAQCVIAVVRPAQQLHIPCKPHELQ